jgi:hypothetical protein
MYPTLWQGDGGKPPVPSWSEACVGLVLSLLLIGGGICYWNYWTGEMDRKAREEVERKVRNMSRYPENIDRQYIEEACKKWQQRNDELMAPVLEAMKQRRLQK